jgi:polyisoprenoid-binding protein YceI
MKTSQRLFLAVVALATAFTSTASAAVETYEIDTAHSSVGFSIRHFVSKTAGSFGNVTGTITVDRDNLEKSSVEAVIAIGSVNTANEKRDGHLKSPDFFDAEKFATATFKSKSWKKTGDDTFDVTGDLTLKGVTKEIVLKTKLLGFGDGMKGAKLSGWESTITLKRSEFGISAYTGAVGEEVALTIGVEGILKK